MNSSRGQTVTKVRCESRLFSQGRTPEFTTMGEIHEVFRFGPFFGLWGVAKGSSIRGSRGSREMKIQGSKLSSGWSRNYEVIKLLLSAGR